MKILLIDENLNLLLKLKNIMESFGLTDMTSDIETALYLIEESIKKGDSYDVVYCDLNVNDSNCLYLLDKVRNLEKQYKLRNSIKVIVASVNFHKNSYFEWFTGDFDDYLIKPFKEIELIEKVIELGEWKDLNKKIKVFNTESWK